VIPITQEYMRNFPLIVILAISAQPALACDLCALYDAAAARGEIGQGIFAGVAEQFTHFGTVQVEGKEVGNPSGQQLDSSITQIFAGYSFNDRLSIQFNAPLIHRAFKRPDDLGGIDQGTESGMGDVSLVASYFLYRKETSRTTLAWNILGGVKFPTGNTDRIKEEFNEVEDPVGPPSGIHGHDLTLGTGSYDGIVGTSLYARLGRGFISANMQYAIRSEGDFKYRCANDLTWSGGPGLFLLMREGITVALQANVSGEDKGTDRFQGETAEDTGVTSVFLGPQISLTWGSKLSAQLGLDVPVSIQNTALQTVTDYRIRAALNWRF